MTREETIAKLHAKYVRAEIDTEQELDLAIYDAAYAAALEDAAKVAEQPYGDAVEAFGSDEPNAVGSKIAAAIRALAKGKDAV